MPAVHSCTAVQFLLHVALALGLCVYVSVCARVHMCMPAYAQWVTKFHPSSNHQGLLLIQVLRVGKQRPCSFAS